MTYVRCLGPAFALALLGLSCGCQDSSAAANSDFVTYSLPAREPEAAIDLHALQALDPAAYREHAARTESDYSHAMVYQRGTSATPIEQRVEACRQDARVVLGLVSEPVCVGADLFFRDGFGGNGRTCGSCHPASNNYTLDRPFIQSLRDDDPLFVAENDPALGQLEHSSLLREHALILVNADGFEDPAHKFVMRSANHIFSLATTIEPTPLLEDGTTFDKTTQPPLKRLGWSGDGSPGLGALRDFQSGAIEQHYTKSLARVPNVDFVPASDAQLDTIAAFMLEVGRKNELDLEAVHLNDAAAERGRLSFVSGPAQECNDCHSNAGANQVITNDDGSFFGLANFNFAIGSETTRLPVLDQLGIPLDGGYGRQPLDLDRDGQPDAFGDTRFNVSSLIEAADTGPYFHANSAATLEEAIEFYNTDAFGTSIQSRRRSLSRPEGGPFVLEQHEIAELGRFLRVLNAAFNCQLAAERVSASGVIADAFNDGAISVQHGLIKLALHDIADARRVLSEVAALNVAAQVELYRAEVVLRRALEAPFGRIRARALGVATAGLLAANAELGTGITYELGSGTLMF